MFQLSRPQRSLAIALLSILLVCTLCCAQESEPEGTARAPIAIASDAEFNAANGVVGGTGTKDDPFVLSGWTIELGDALAGIRIKGTRAWFEIVACTIRGPGRTGICFLDVQNGTIRDCTIENAEYGIDVDSSRDCVFAGNRIEGCTSSVFLYAASFNTFSANTVREGLHGITLYEGSTSNQIFDNSFEAGSVLTVNVGCDGNWIYRNDFLEGRAISYAYNSWHSREREGNYWSNYCGDDTDGDGYGELAYRLLGSLQEFDYHPAIMPYHPLEE